MKQATYLIPLILLIAGCKNTHNYNTYRFYGDVKVTQTDGTTPFIASTIDSQVEQASDTDVTDNQADGKVDLLPVN